MLSFSKKISFFNTKPNCHQKRLYQQSPKNFKLSLQEATFENVTQLYEHVFDMLIQKSNEEFDQKMNEKPLLFCHIGNDILKITLNTKLNSFSLIYNRLLKYRCPSERHLIEIKAKKNKIKINYKHLKDKNSDDDAITKKIENLKNQYKEIVKKIAEIKNEIVSCQISMIEFLVDVRLALTTLSKNDPLVLCFNNICDKIFNDNHSETESISQFSRCEPRRAERG